MPGRTWCYSHDPARSEERARNAARGGRRGGRGRSSLSPELEELKAQLKELTDAVLKGTYLVGQAAVANQLLNTRLRLIEVERKLKETEELERRLDALEVAARPGPTLVRRRMQDGDEDEDVA